MTAPAETALVPEALRGGVLVAGAGVSGLGAARLLDAVGVTCVVADDNPANREKVAGETSARAVSTADATELFDEVSIVVTSPGWRPDSPLLVAAQDAVAASSRVRAAIDDILGLLAGPAPAAAAELRVAGPAETVFDWSRDRCARWDSPDTPARAWRGADGRVIGVVGVIGPTRLNYARVVPIVDFTAATLSRLMGPG